MHTSMIYRSRQLLQILVAVVILFSLPIVSNAQTKKQLEKEKQQIEQQIKKLNQELASAKKDTKNSTAQLKVLNQRIKERTRLINNINAQMSIIDGQIAHTQDSMQQLQARIDSLKAEYGKIIRVLYSERSSLDRTNLMLDADSYNKAFLRRKYFQEYSRYRKMQAAAIRAQEDELKGINLNLVKQKNEKNTLLNQEKKEKEELAKEQSQQQQQVKKSQQREKDLTAQLTKKEKERVKLQQQIQRIINEEIAKARKAAEAERKAKEAAEKKAREEAAKKQKTNNKTTKKTADNKSTSKPVEKKTPNKPAPEPTATDAASTDFAANKGKLSWPVYYKKVAREYGRYTHESGGQNMNNGIDLITSSGAEVTAVYKGKVTRVFTCPNGTKGIIIRHGEYMTVYANLSNVTVKENTTVSTKQKIGTVQTGSDGVSEFSFQIWKSTQSQNPRSWLK
ncbi:MAG: peptidoglycan DD-metalloendopeptidase family protein [Bacteroidales bacterium]|nr:peptidoglycan DD-metalloendopeptidase family protein [Bacteroidales bacterium]